MAERTLDRLTEVGLIDDADFAQQWVRSRHLYSGKGKRAIALELRRKGIDQQDAADALDTIDSESERDRAVELVRKKLRTQRRCPPRGIVARSRPNATSWYDASSGCSPVAATRRGWPSRWSATSSGLSKQTRTNHSTELSARHLTEEGR